MIHCMSIKTEGFFLEVAHPELPSHFDKHFSFIFGDCVLKMCLLVGFPFVMTEVVDSFKTCSEFFF